MDYNNAIKIMDDYINLLPLLELKKQNKYEQAIQLIIEKTKCDEITAKAVYSDLTHDLMENKTDQQNDCKISNQVTCPYCHSTNIHKITGTERAVSVIGLGLLSKKINKSFKCKNCSGTF